MYKIIISLFLLLILPGCSSMLVSVDGYNCRKLLNKIPNEESGLDIQKFLALDDNEEYAFYMCEQIYYTPSLDRLAFYYAQGGARIIPLLSKRLVAAKDDLIIFNIIKVFEEMQRQKIYDVSKNQDLILLLDEKISMMKEYPDQDFRSYRDIALSKLKKIKYQMPFN